MTIRVGVPEADGLTEVLDALADWQDELGPLQLHPGDVGWFGRFGPPATAAAVRTWSVERRIGAVALLDGPALARLAFAPDLVADEALADRVARDVAEPARGVLPAGEVVLDAPTGSLLHERLTEAGWALDEAWSPLRRGLGEPVEGPDARIEVVGPERAAVRVALQRASFANSTFTLDAWRAMAAGPAYARARCLIAYDAHDVAVAAVTVWSAGVGRPGLIEPMGVHREHRGRGHGTAITLAGIAALGELGSSSATVTTPSSNAAAVATYAAAGLRRLPETRDRRRDA
ncbi:MAG TPA: GNAT family N-acetyltransferase [Acidimicrobiales bacterium]|nr:MAG: GNAT family N-acetyltransferase [Actinobacteria bacterium 21-73-9]HQU26857.1 GNAT family N-acetyltransferase [Acidimicrobiales bacterium]